METYYLLTLKNCAYLFGFITILIALNVLTIKMVLSKSHEISVMSHEISVRIGDIRLLIADNIQLQNENEKMTAKMNRIKHSPIPVHIKDAYITSQINLNTECVLCLENIESINSSHLTNCGHLFHTECFNKIRVVRNKRKCPTCRT